MFAARTDHSTQRVQVETGAIKKSWKLAVHGDARSVTFPSRHPFGVTCFRSLFRMQQARHGSPHSMMKRRSWSDALQMKWWKSRYFGLTQELDFAEYERRFNSMLFQQYQIKCRAKQETYQDEAKLRVSCVGINKIDHVQRCRELVQLISQMA
jgi:Replication factor-A C terminal domain